MLIVVLTINWTFETPENYDKQWDNKSLSAGKLDLFWECRFLIVINSMNNSAEASCNQGNATNAATNNGASSPTSNLVPNFQGILIHSNAIPKQQ